ncbi:MAG: MFS transporter [Phormidesmis sp.]
MEFVNGLKWATSLYDPGELASLLAQVIVNEEYRSFNGGQFFAALLSGVILAFGFQLLLTNLSVATGVSYLAHSSNSSDSDSDSSGSLVKTIGLAFGAWTLVTVSLALFFACWLAVSLGEYEEPLLGITIALVIWATYFSLLTWISSTTVGSLIGSVIKSATDGFQTLFGTATAAIGAKAASSQVVRTAEETAAAVRREFTDGLDIDGLQNNLQSYFSKLVPSSVDVESIEQEFEKLIKSADFGDVAKGDMPEITRDLFVEMLSDRTNLSEREVNDVADRLYKSWQRNTGSKQSGGMSDLLSFVASASAGQIASEGLGGRLDKLVREVQGLKDGGDRTTDSDGSQDKSNDGPIAQAMSQGISSVIGMVTAKAGLSDLDTNKIIGQIKAAQKEISGQAEGISPRLGDALSADENIIETDVEYYIHHAYIGELKSPQMEEVFRNVLYDDAANTTELKQQLSSIDRKVFQEALAARGLLTQSEIKDISTRMEIVRQQTLKDVISAEAVAAEARVQQQLETFFRYTPVSELRSEMGSRAFRALIEEENLDAEYLRTRIGEIRADVFRQAMTGREDIDPNEAGELAERYHQQLEKVIADAEGVQEAAKVRVQQQAKSVEEYLRNTGKEELNPDGIKRDLAKLLSEPNEGIGRVRGRVAKFDRDTLVQLLAGRPEFSEGDVNGVVDSVEKNWHAAMSTPQKVTATAQAKYDEATTAIAEYLRSTGKPELSPEGIQRDVEKLINHPKAGMRAMRYRLSKMDRDTLVQLLSAREDLSEDEINQTIDSFTSSIQSVVKLPRRFARRTQSRALSFQTALEDYLSNTDKSELNPDGIKRDLKLLLSDPKLGASKLGDRLSEMDDSTMVALLAQRSDMSEEEARQVVQQVADVRHQTMEQIRSVKRNVESVLNQIFARIRRFLDSLERPELNYDGIERDVRLMMDDPNAGFGAMRDRLSQFDRNTLVSLVTSQGSISERDANRVIDKVESARDNVLGKAERIERQIESRLVAIKEQTSKQVEDTKKAAEAASWWLFGTALISAVCAAIGGAIATG